MARIGLVTVARRGLPVVGLGLLISGAGIALASWSSTGIGTASGSVGDLDAPGNVTVSPHYNTVDVTWDAVAPPDGALDGYVITRSDAGDLIPACGTDIDSPATYVPAGTLTCTDTAVPDGIYTYNVTAVFRSWTSTSEDSNAISVSGDPSNPSLSVSMAAPTNAYLGGSTIYFRSSVPGGFRLNAAVADGESGPASATFGAVGASGWTHPAETVTVGTGTSPTTYSSSPFTWSAGAATPGPVSVAGQDVGGNSVQIPLSFTADNSGPTGGALTVNGVAATGPGSTSSARLAFPINVRTDYGADFGSGLASSVLTRQSAPFAGNTCGTFGAAATITGTPNQTGLSTGCYRYTLTGTDRVGNVSSVSTTVRYDVAVPTQSISLASPGGASMTGTTIYVRTNVAGSFTLTSAVSDDQTGPASVTFPAVTTNRWTHPAQTVSSGTGTAPTVSYTSSTYSWTAGAGRPGNTTLTALDVIGNSGTTALAFVRDTTAPTGGALAANGTNSTVGGSTSFNRTGTFIITRTDYTDAASQIASSVLTVEQGTLTNNVCSAYGAPVELTGAPAQSGLATGCYRYRLTGTDKVGNTVNRSTVVKVDREAPTGGALSVNGTAATGGGSTSTINSGSFAINTRTDWTDSASGIATSTLVRTQATLTGNTCGTFGTATTLTGNPTQTGLTTNCYRYALTGTDNAGNTTSVTSDVKVDLTNPTGGTLTVNGVAASGGGSTSTSNAGSFTLTRTDYTDANSGLASSALTRSFATLTGTTCGTFGAATSLTGSPVQTGLAPGCYRYTLTGTDNAGNTVSLSTTVSQRVVITAVALVNGSGTAGRVDAGDRIDITYSDAMAVATICSAWSGNATDQMLGGNNNVSVVMTNGGAANDTLTISATSCTFNVGSINLGSTGYATANVTFRGTGGGASTAAWNAGTRTLSITLGTASGGGASTVATSAPVVTPSGALTNTNGVVVGGTFTLPGVRQF